MTRIVLSYGQQRLWTLACLDRYSASYNVPLALRLKGDLNEQALRHALATVVDRHQPLRTTIEPRNRTVPAGRLHAAPAPAHILTIQDISEVPSAERPTTLVRMLDELFTLPFDLLEDLPFRAKLLRLDSKDSVFALSLHHCACDGVSMGILVNELSLAYNAA